MRGRRAGRTAGPPDEALRNRRRVQIAAGALTVSVLAVALTASPAWSPTSSTQRPQSWADGGEPGSVEPPQDGAWIGAWVKPEPDTDGGRIAAVNDFETQLGRPLDLVHVYRTWEDPWPTADERKFVADGKQLLLSWAGTDTRAIVAGQHDELIRTRARALAAWGAPIMLQWRWEMDRPNLQDEVHGPEAYIAAWRHIRAIFAEEGATSASWVWCPLAIGFVDGRAQPFYPGDADVDWICADVYPGRDVKPFATAAGPFLDWAAERPHPIVIGEFGMQVKRGEKVRQRWLADTGDFVKTQPQIKGLVYFDADRTNATPSYDMSLRNAPGSMAAFADMAHDPYFDVKEKP